MVIGAQKTVPAIAQSGRIGGIVQACPRRFRNGQGHGLATFGTAQSGGGMAAGAAQMLLSLVLTSVSLEALSDAHDPPISVHRPKNALSSIRKRHARLSERSLQKTIDRGSA
jgi:hypothetical protein